MLQRHEMTIAQAVIHDCTFADLEKMTAKDYDQIVRNAAQDQIYFAMKERGQTVKTCEIACNRAYDDLNR